MEVKEATQRNEDAREEAASVATKAAEAFAIIFQQIYHHTDIKQESLETGTREIDKYLTRHEESCRIQLRLMHSDVEEYTQNTI